MLNRFRKFIAENNLTNPGDRILLAVSGGIDSMVMTHLFLRLDHNMGIAHCNFSLRDEESDKDEEMVRKFAGEHNIPFFSTRFKTKIFAKENGLSVQMAARELRYIWFEKIRSENLFDKIAVAHNLNDNIETLIINLTRGTGIAGLTGMRPISNRIIRPLLFASRKDITEYCLQNQITFREDKSNSDTKYTRNKIRHLVLPVLKEINPSIETTLSETAERFTGINEMIAEYISGIMEKVSEKKNESIIFNINLLKPYLNNKTRLFELFRPYGINTAQTEDLINIFNGTTGGQVFTDSHRIIRNREEIIVSRLSAVNETDYVITDICGFRNVPVITSAEYIDITSKSKIPSDKSIACIDSEKILFPMTIRKWRAGDHFYPLGMKQKKKLSDYFIDNKYSRIDKEEKLILESAGEIVWIVGDRIDDRFRITSSTKKGLLIKSKSLKE